MLRAVDFVFLNARKYISEIDRNIKKNPKLYNWNNDEKSSRFNPIPPVHVSSSDFNGKI